MLFLSTYLNRVNKTDQLTKGEMNDNLKMCILLVCHSLLITIDANVKTFKL